jgi:methylated-DNA-protein-cysteine methyltransferase-like protein
VAADFRERVLAVVAGLAAGEVVSYGDVAAQAGFPGAARAVGAVLARSDGLPWWRVVMSTGHLAPGKERDQGRRLRAEGVTVVDGRVRVDRRRQRPAGSQR